MNINCDTKTELNEKTEKKITNHLEYKEYFKSESNLKKHLKSK